MTASADEEDGVITFDTLCNLYVKEGSFSSPAELHGQLCGQLCGEGSVEKAAFFQMAREQMALDTQLSEESLALLQRLYLSTCRQLDSADLDFSLLLPDDSDPLSQRLQCLSQWCHGFLAGYGLSGIRQEKLSEEARSILSDLVQIVRVDTDVDAPEQDEEMERDFMEICEYVRLAVLTLFDEKAGKSTRTSAMMDQTVH